MAGSDELDLVGSIVSSPVRRRILRPRSGPRRSRRPSGRSGQGLVEFALVVPIFMLFFGGIIQFGMIFWAQNTLNQVVRDAGRYGATLTTCSASSVTSRLTSLAAASSGAWTLDSSSESVSFYSVDPATGALVTTVCPPTDNQTYTFIHVEAAFDVFRFFPWIPGNGHVTSATEFRMEPRP